MDIDAYFNALSEGFESAYAVATSARKMGYDPKDYVEIKPAPDLASRVEGIINMPGLSEIIKQEMHGQSRSELAFNVVKVLCSDDRLSGYESIKKVEIAVRVGLAILTEGILVAPTEGIQSIRLMKNRDNSDYIDIEYAGPIRGAGGTAAALSVALADYARRFFGIGAYKPTDEEVERYVEEVDLYDTRVAHLQYRPPDDDIRVIVKNCPVCIDGVGTSDTELNVHRDIKRKEANGKEVRLTNKVRSGMPLVLCEGIAQKAKKLLKEVKSTGLDWGWLNNIIKIDKVGKSDTQERESVFLEELVAGRPVLAYPKTPGGFRLRYGRSRFTGIAAKGFSPATMVLADKFIAVGTQIKVELPGKGCIAMPVDSIEGPFVRLKSGEAMRINDAETAEQLKDEIDEIIALGDILITYGDFKKSNTLLQPSSYVEEIWEAQLRKNGGEPKKEINFADAYEASVKYNVPIHPKYLYEFQEVGKEEVEELAKAIIRNSKVNFHEGSSGKSVFDISSIEILADAVTKRTLELMCVPHKFINGNAVVQGDYAQSLVATLGFASGPDGSLDISELVIDKYSAEYDDTISMLNSVAPFRLMRRSTNIGARIGRPEKAKERLMKPAPNLLFPIGNYGGKERNLTKAYAINSKKLGDSMVKVEMARYKCDKCKRELDTPYCYDCGAPAKIVYKCTVCGAESDSEVCGKCGGTAVAYEERGIDLVKALTNAMKRVGVAKLPNTLKGVKGLTNKNKVVEPIEKGILRSMHEVYIFKDGTARFDATDAPITHFYPGEIGVSVEKLKALGYDRDYLGNPLEREDQLVELRHQDVILNRRGAEYLLKVARFVDDMLENFYKVGRFYNATTVNDLVGQLVITLSPHTSCGVLGRIIGFTDANVGLAHPYMITARRRNSDGDEDTTMLLLDALVNFSREYLPVSTGGTMDAPLILTLHVMPEEVDDEVHAMEVVGSYPLDFYEKSFDYASPSDVKVELVGDRLGKKESFQDLKFTHSTSMLAIKNSPKRSVYSTLNTMQEKVEREFDLVDKIHAVNKRDVAKKLITSHFIPDLIGNLHTFSRQSFRCTICNAKYRRVPLMGKCPKDGGRLLLTVSKGSIEKYLDMAIQIAKRYELESYMQQRLQLIKEEIDSLFGGSEEEAVTGQFNLGRFV